MWTFEIVKGADLLTSSLVVKGKQMRRGTSDGGFPGSGSWLRRVGQPMSFYESFPTKGANQAATDCFSNSST